MAMATPRARPLHRQGIAVHAQFPEDLEEDGEDGGGGHALCKCFHLSGSDLTFVALSFTNCPHG